MSKLFETLQQCEMASGELPTLLSFEGRELFGDLIPSRAVESRKAPVCLSSPGMIGDELALWFSQDVIDELVALLAGGYQFCPWGGIEVGGVFFGTTESDGVHIRSYQSIMSDHQHGPSFKLSQRDLDGLTQSLANAKKREYPKGLRPVGWFHSVCNRAAALNEHDTQLHDQFFSEPWQVAIILKGSKNDPVTIGLSFREDKRPIPLQPRRLFTLGDFRSKSSAAQTEAAVRVRLGFKNILDGQASDLHPHVHPSAAHAGSLNSPLADANEAEYAHEPAELCA